MLLAIGNVVVVGLWFALTWILSWRAKKTKRSEDSTAFEKRIEKFEETLQKNMTQNIMVLLELMGDWSDDGPPSWKLRLVEFAYLVTVFIEFVATLRLGFTSRSIDEFENRAFRLDFSQVCLGGLLSLSNLDDCPTLLMKTAFDAKSLWDEAMERIAQAKEKEDAKTKQEKLEEDVKKKKEENEKMIEKANEKEKELAKMLEKFEKEQITRQQLEKEKDAAVSFRTFSKLQKKHKMASERYNSLVEEQRKKEEKKEKKRIKQFADLYQELDLGKAVARIMDAKTHTLKESVGIFKAMQDTHQASRILGALETGDAASVLSELAKNDTDSEIAKKDTDLELAATLLMRVHINNSEVAASILSAVESSSKDIACKILSAVIVEEDDYYVASAILAAVRDKAVACRMIVGLGKGAATEILVTTIEEDEENDTKKAADILLGIREMSPRVGDEKPEKFWISVWTEIGDVCPGYICMILHTIAASGNVGEVVQILSDIASEDDDALEDDDNSSENDDEQSADSDEGSNLSDQREGGEIAVDIFQVWANEDIVEATKILVEMGKLKTADFAAGLIVALKDRDADLAADLLCQLTLPKAQSGQAVLIAAMVVIDAVFYDGEEAAVAIMDDMDAAAVAKVLLAMDDDDKKAMAFVDEEYYSEIDAYHIFELFSLDAERAKEINDAMRKDDPAKAEQFSRALADADMFTSEEKKDV